MLHSNILFINIGIVLSNDNSTTFHLSILGNLCLLGFSMFILKKIFLLSDELLMFLLQFLNNELLNN